MDIINKKLIVAISKYDGGIIDHSFDTSADNFNSMAAKNKVDLTTEDSSKYFKIITLEELLNKQLKSTTTDFNKQ